MAAKDVKFHDSARARIHASQLSSLGSKRCELDSLICKHSLTPRSLNPAPPNSQKPLNSRCSALTISTLKH